MLKRIALTATLAAAAGLVATGATAQSVTFGTVDWAPYYGSKLPEKGFVSALTRAAYKDQGYDFKVKFMPFSRAMNMAKAGKLDGVLGAWYSDERASKFKYSEPIVDTKNVLMARKELGIASYDSLKELKGYSIAVSRGWAYGEAFDEASFLNKQVANNQIVNMRKLFRGRVDMMAVEQRVFRYEAKQKDSFDLSKVTALTPPLNKTPIYNIVANGHSKRDALIAAFNKGLKAIKDNGTYDAILSRLNQDV